MNILVNGDDLKVEESITINDLICILELSNKKIAVAVNQEIIPASLYKQTLLDENNEIEIVRAVGGG